MTNGMDESLFLLATKIQAVFFSLKEQNEKSAMEHSRVGHVIMNF
jgi:hypothetical protein